MIWRNSDEGDSRVRSASGWQPIDRVGRLPAVALRDSAVFIFADDARDVLYIGSADRAERGIERAISQGNDGRAGWVKILHTFDESDAEDLAYDLVRDYRPQYN